MKLIDIYNGYTQLGNFKNQNTISFILAWKIDDIMELMYKHVRRFDGVRDSLIKELGELKEGSENEYTFSPDTQLKFNEKVEELASTEIELDFEKIPYELFSKEENLKVGGDINMNILKKFITLC